MDTKRYTFAELRRLVGDEHMRRGLVAYLRAPYVTA
jgi:hypothetical protein